MILTRKVVPGLAVCIALTTVASAYYQGIGEAPKLFFGGDDAFLVAPPGGRLIGTDTVPAGLTGPLRSLASVRGASAEIYVATAIDGRTVMARGVDPAAFLSMENATIARGRAPENAREALAGEGFARAFDLEPGDAIVLPGSFARTGARLTIAGVVDVAGPANEELMISLEAARGLTGVGPKEVHLIRVATFNRTEVKALVESIAPTFTYSDVQLSASTFLPGEQVTMRANLTNWGRIEGVKVVQVRQDGVAIAERAYRVPPFATIPVSVDFAVPRTGTFNITVNPTFVVEVGTGNLSFVESPPIVATGQRFTVRIDDQHGNDAAGVWINATGVSTVTDASGTASLSITRAGRHLLKAERDLAAGEVAVRDIYVIEPGLENASSGAVVGVVLGAVEYGAARSVHARVELENRGGVAGNVSVPLRVNGTIVAYANATLGAGERNWTSVSFRAPVGNHTLRAVNGSVNATFRVVPGDDPRIDALLRGYDERARSPQISSTSGDSADEYIRRTIGNIGAAVLILSLVSGALASLGAVAILARHIAERRSSLGVVKSLGARDGWLVDVITWEAARYGGVAAALGVGGGVVGALAIDALGVVRAFGHAVHPVLSWTTLGLIFLVSTLSFVVAARLLVRDALATPAEALTRASDADAPLVPLARVVEARR